MCSPIGQEPLDAGNWYISRRPTPEAISCGDVSIIQSKESRASGGLHLAPAGMKNPFCVGCPRPLKNQIRRRLKGMTVDAGPHRPIERIVGVLLIDDFRHPPQGVRDLPRTTIP
jgi:hypothetical protein